MTREGEKPQLSGNVLGKYGGGQAGDEQRRLVAGGPHAGMVYLRQARCAAESRAPALSDLRGMRVARKDKSL